MKAKLRRLLILILFALLTLQSATVNSQFNSLRLRGSRPISVLATLRDTTTGFGISRVTASFYKLLAENDWKFLQQTSTRGTFGSASFSMEAGDSIGTVYKIVLDTEPYYTEKNLTTFYPYVEVIFQKQDETFHMVPILVSPYDYSSYRGHG